MKFDTKVLHAAIKPDPITGSILPPLYQTATYVLEEVGKDKGSITHVLLILHGK
tara:strand:- start:99 stop:260 length:162 start_codon:yes stop_codon:yes gene_type:complete